MVENVLDLYTMMSHEVFSVANGDQYISNLVVFEIGYAVPGICLLLHAFTDNPMFSGSRLLLHL